MANKCKILLVEPVTHDINRFIIEKPKGFRFTPGQACEVSINKKGLEDKKRPFTFTCLNSDLVLEFIIKGYPEHKGITDKIHKLKPGDELLIGNPWGAISYKGPGVFIAGGAGITPFIAIFKDLFSKNKLKGNRLIFSNKTKKDIIYEQEFLAMFDKKDLTLTLTREKRENYLNEKVDEKLLKKEIKDLSQPFYICGPKKMVKDLKDTFKMLGVRPSYLVFEK
jgi:glycine betaine catabolism B